MPAADSEHPFLGLCRQCVFMRRIRSSRGTTFYRCDRSDIDPRFPKYPQLPVIACAGFTPGGAAPAAPDGDAEVD
jgi:hypothetical protein